jgi:hypothetical protein
MDVIPNGAEGSVRELKSDDSVPGVDGNSSAARGVMVPTGDHADSFAS